MILHEKLAPHMHGSGKGHVKKADRDLLPLADLTPNPRNPRRHAEAQLIHLQASLERFGQTRRILARKANKMIIAGHGIFEAANRCGMTEVEVLLWDVMNSGDRR